MKNYKYRTIPREVRAFLWNGDNVQAVKSFLIENRIDYKCGEYKNREEYLEVPLSRAFNDHIYEPLWGIESPSFLVVKGTRLEIKPFKDFIRTFEAV